MRHALSLIGFFLFVYGVVEQILHTLRVKSVRDISMRDVTMRCVGCTLVSISILFTGDWSLIAGTAINEVAMLTYGGIVFYYWRRG